MCKLIPLASAEQQIQASTLGHGAAHVAAVFQKGFKKRQGDLAPVLTLVATVPDHLAHQLLVPPERHQVVPIRHGHVRVQQLAHPGT